MRTNIFRTVLVALVAMMSLSASAQNSREYIRNAIKEWGECRNVAITKTNGDLALYGDNGCARQGCPRDLNDVLSQLHREKKFISDVQLTENGRWLVLYGTNGIKWSNNLPAGLKDKLKEFNKNYENITSATFNDYNEWIAVSDKHYAASSTEILNWLSDGAEKYGTLWTACITEDARVAVYESGYKFYGNVPDDLRDALRETELDVYCLKIAGTAWFFADKDGSYVYNM